MSGARVGVQGVVKMFASMQLAASLLVDVECMVSTTLFSLVAVEHEKTITMNA
jgi:hypothetical protein